MPVDGEAFENLAKTVRTNAVEKVVKEKKAAYEKRVQLPGT
jgi:hypothetical protein